MKNIDYPIHEYLETLQLYAIILIFDIQTFILSLNSNRIGAEGLLNICGSDTNKIGIYLVACVLPLFRLFFVWEQRIQIDCEMLHKL